MNTKPKHKLILSSLTLITALTITTQTAFAASPKSTYHPPKQTHSSFPHQKRTHLSPTFHQQKTTSKGKYIGSKPSKTSTHFHTVKPVKIKTYTPKLTKIKAVKAPHITKIKVHTEHTYKTKVVKFKVPKTHFKPFKQHVIKIHYKK